MSKKVKVIRYKLPEKQPNAFQRLADRLFGGLNMSWTAVIVMAVACAAVTAVFLIVPVFRNTSFERMGVHLEFWFLPAILIMSNCKAPLESALKTFVFFLVSQPLIYLLQVPFSSRGWGIFGYYGYWFMLTLATFPMAYAGWYIKKRSWLSALILSPVLAYMGLTLYDRCSFCMRHFPHYIVTCIFCILQAAVYVFVFFPHGWYKKLIGLLIPVAAAAVMAFSAPQAGVDATAFLPDDPVLSEQAVIITGEGGFADISIRSTGENSMLRITAERYGTMAFSIMDGDREYSYTLTVYEDEEGHSQIRITRR